MNDDGVMSFWVSYLLLAIRDMDHPYYARAAQDFVMSDDRRPLGFVWTCEQLDIDPGRLRSKCSSREGRSQIKHGNHYTHRRLKRAA